jgi:hypothetical protein
MLHSWNLSLTLMPYLHADPTGDFNFKQVRKHKLSLKI